ncbi:MAG: polysaccharide biosynthesis protein [Defluviitaleaceae bacterium]|nr:polysaccharide biosynthesis protein [Defluviitaleaceae bacterium]
MTKSRFSVFNTLLLSLLDSLFCWISWFVAVVVFSYFFVNDFAHYIAAVNRSVWVMVLACSVFYTVCGVYKSLWAHPGVGTMIRITVAVLLSSFTVYVSLRLRLGHWPNPGIGMMAFYFILSFCLVLRIHKRVLAIVFMYMRRFINSPRLHQEEPVRTLVVGAGESASGFLLHPSQQGGRPRDVIAMLDNDRNKHGYRLHGKKIMGSDELIPHLVKKYNISEIIVAVPSINNEDLRRIVRLAPVNHCKVRLLSGLSQDRAGDALREIRISDLMGRPEAAINESGINAWLKGKTVLVTGGGGSVGSELCRQLIRLNVDKIVVFDISENNAHNLKEELKVSFGQAGRYKVAVRIGSIQDAERLDLVFNEFKPAIVFHAAAYKHVPLMEECPRLAIDNNVVGTYRTALAAVKHGVERFVMISTDKAVNPTNVMGASKRLAEIATLGLNMQSTTEFVCVRFGNVLDSNGSVIPIFKRQIEAGGPVTVMHPDIIRYFMTISEAAKLVLETGAMAAGGELFILDMGEQVKIKDLAENLIRMAGLIPDVDIKIEYIGLRPGEKLYEELLRNEEGLTATLNDKIFVARPEISPKLDNLMEALGEGLPWEGDVREMLKYYVPEYNPM